MDTATRARQARYAMELVAEWMDAGDGPGTAMEAALTKTGLEARDGDRSAALADIWEWMPEGDEARATMVALIADPTVHTLTAATLAIANENHDDGTIAFELHEQALQAFGLA